MKFKSLLLFIVATAPILSNTPTPEATMNTVDPMNQAAQAIAGLAIQLKAQVPAYENLVAAIDTQLTMECPTAADPLCQEKLETVWEIYRLALRDRQTVASATADLYQKAVTDLTALQNLADCGPLLSTFQGKLNELQAKAKEQDTRCGGLANEVVVLAPSVAQQLKLEQRDLAAVK